MVLNEGGRRIMNLRASLFNLYWAARHIIAPSLRYSQYSYEEILKHYVGPETQWVDIGCGHSLLPSWRAEEERQLIKSCKRVMGIDYDLDSLKAHSTISRKLRGNITKLPFKSSSFDLVTANMVVEHLDCPTEQFQEVNRILQPKGIFLFHTPNALGYGVMIARLVPEWLRGKMVYLLEGRQEHDVFKTYYRANTKKRIGELARAYGFEVVRIEMLSTDAIFVMIPPLVVLELLWIRILMTRPFRLLRTNIIAVLRKVQ